MRYFERLPMISPGTLVATSQGVASYITTGHLVYSTRLSRPLMQLVRNGQTILELSDEWVGNWN